MNLCQLLGVSCVVSVDLAGIGPGGKPGDDVELPEEIADYLVGVFLGAESIELREDFDQRLLDVADRTLGIELALRLETLLALHEFFPIEIGYGMNYGLAGRARICQEAG